MSTARFDHISGRGSAKTRHPSTRTETHNGSVSEILDVLQIGLLALISVACVATVLVNWWDDRNFRKHM